VRKEVAVDYDLVVRGGLIVDGSGEPGYQGDVAVAGGRIAEVGKVAGSGRTEIDADGLVVAPGFVDGHTHMDAQVFWDELGSSSCWQGVTTAVMGNCGYTLAPVRADQRRLVSINLERAEDIPAGALAEGVPWTWSTFSEYLDVVDALPKGINYAGSIGHSALRIRAMGERAFDSAATEDDLAVMERELSDALRAGAMGLSTSRNKGHTTSDDRPVASRAATWDELTRLITLIGRESSGNFQMGGDEGASIDEHLRRLQRLAISTGVPIVNNTGDPGAIPLFDETVTRGGQLWILTHCRGFCVLQSFRSKLSFDFLPGTEWASVRSRPLAEQRQLLQDPDVRARLIHAAHHGTYQPVSSADPFKPDFEKIFTMSSSYLPTVSVAEEARRRGVDPVDVMIDTALADDFNTVFVQSFWDTSARAFYAGEKEDEFATLLRNPNTAMTFTDAGAHQGQVSDCSIQTHLLAYWVRERQLFSLEEAVRMITHQPAKVWHLRDRGLLTQGYAADITIFDPATVAPQIPQVVHDVPGGASRFEQRAVGYHATIVNGQVFTQDGKPTEARAGRLLRAGRA
jgi:N-acyl-D-amino-acid deacylase